MSDIAATAIFLVTGGTFFLAIHLIEKAVRDSFARRRAAKLDALVARHQKKDYQAGVWTTPGDRNSTVE